MSECKFDYELLPSRKIKYIDSEKVIFTYSGLFRVISKENPCIIIANAFSLATMKIWWRSLFKKIPYIIWSGAINNKYRADSFIRKYQRKIVVNKASGFIAYGTRAKEYLISLGAKKEMVEIGINTVDIQFYANEIRKYRENEISNDDKRHLLYIGDLSPRKNVLKVLKIIDNLVKLRSDIMLDIVGDGNERNKLEKYVADNNLNSFVIFHGFKQREEIPKFMAQADCFLFQTDFDIWGLVLVEAMVAGLPCIASVHAGATEDLIKDGVTGFTMDFCEVEKVIERINWILENPELTNKIGHNACLFISQNVTLEKSAAGFVRAIIKKLQIE